ncbi:MAG: DUF3306 domain-containing protein [Burkholderiales bacterium]|nr:DUF3306 domain-containing protein [Burkholderiales bacterium]
MTDPEDKEAFSLSRWSRRKHEAARAAPAPPPPASTPAPPVAPAVAAAAEAPLPAVESLTFESDFTAFLSPKVEEGVRRAALRKLFSDPRFNVMDGLDVYIDDYSKPDPMPEGMLAKLKDVYEKFSGTEEQQQEEAAASAPTKVAQAESAEAPPSAATPKAQDDADG